MASSLAFKQRFLSFTPLISRSLLRPVASSAARFFNTNATPQYDERADDRNLDVDGHSDRPIIFRRVRDYSTVIERGPYQAFHNALDIWNSSKDFWYLLVDMPGHGKEDVKISVKRDTFIFQAKGFEDRKQLSRYYALFIKGKGLEERKIPLLPRTFKLDQIKAEVKNGVIKVILPLIKKEEEWTSVPLFRPSRPVEFNVEIE